MAESITIKELKTLLKGDKPLKIIDVRRREDYESNPSKLPGAQWHDPMDLETWINGLPLVPLTVAYCVKGGPVSQSVVKRLNTEGVNAAFLEGGIKAWTADGDGTP